MGSVTAKLRPGPGALLLISGLLVGCATAGGVGPPKASPTVTSDGLVSTPSRLGVLFVKPGHNIGGYDQIFFSPMSISYKRGRKALGEEEEAEFLVALERGEVVSPSRTPSIRLLCFSSPILPRSPRPRQENSGSPNAAKVETP